MIQVGHGRNAICRMSRLKLRGESFHKILYTRNNPLMRPMAFALLPLVITMPTAKQGVLCIIAEF
jgi:hypothetical protein